MIKEGHQFERARREFGFEEGVFVDGAFLGTSEVIDLATLPLQQRQQRIAEHRASEKQFACNAVIGYMECLHVSLDDLLRYFEARAASSRTRP